MSSVFALLVLIRLIHFEAIILALGNLLLKFKPSWLCFSVRNKVDHIGGG